MTKKELETIRKKNIHSIVNTLMMMGKDIKVDPNQEGFTWGGKRCHVNLHKMVGTKRKYVVVEYCTDTRADIQENRPISIFMDYENPDVFYSIATDKLYELINTGLTYDPGHFHITNTGDVLKNAGICISIDFDTFTELEGIRTFNIREIVNDLPKQYEKLVNKLVNQYHKKGVMAWDQLSSMAWEGFAIAINTFDHSRSDMTFTKFTAFSIRNNILTCVDNELRTVKLSNYAQKKVQEKWGDKALFNTVSVNHQVNEDDNTPKELKLNMYTKAKFDDGNVFDYIFSRLEENFGTRDCEIFYMSFGFNGYNETKGKDIAKHFDISEGLVSQRVKKITTWMRGDEEICEMLQNLF